MNNTTSPKRAKPTDASRRAVLTNALRTMPAGGLVVEFTFESGRWLLAQLEASADDAALDQFAAAALSATLREDQSSDDAVHQAYEVGEMMLEERTRRRAARAAALGDTLKATS